MSRIPHLSFRRSASPHAGTDPYPGRLAFAAEVSGCVRVTGSSIKRNGGRSGKVLRSSGIATL